MAFRKWPIYTSPSTQGIPIFIYGSLNSPIIRFKLNLLFAFHFECVMCVFSLHIDQVEKKRVRFSVERILIFFFFSFYYYYYLTRWRTVYESRLEICLDWIYMYAYHHFTTRLSVVTIKMEIQPNSLSLSIHLTLEFSNVILVKICSHLDSCYMFYMKDVCSPFFTLYHSVLFIRLLYLLYYRNLSSSNAILQAPYK